MIKDLVEYIVKKIVASPDDVSVSIVATEDKESVVVKVRADDKGKVIGRDGQTIKSLRTVADLLVDNNKKISIDIAK